MSKINGDKARFHKNRKEKIERRERNREMLKTLGTKSAGAPASAPKSK
jgi:hypothetical protein